MASAKLKGHAAHSKAADMQNGLPGLFTRPVKVTMIGAGSGFTPTVMNDILQIPGNRGGEIALVDIDRKRLTTMHTLITMLVASHGLEDTWSVTASTERTDVLNGTDYLINSIEVSGVDCVRYDNDIPLEYGVSQCIGDTIGPGGLFKGLRTIPVWLEILRDAEELCPEALVLSYTNPMSMMCCASGRASSMNVTGLCHSVQGTSHLLARRAGVPYEELTWECAGINHFAWITRLEHKGRDLYPKLKRMARKDLAGEPVNKKDKWDLVRKDMMLQFGAFITESSGHLSEYLPYYRKNKKAMRGYCRKGYHGETSFYADGWPQWRKEADERRMRMVRGEESFERPRSWEYASWIIESREKNAPFYFYGNVMNSVDGADALISNLPHDGCVEVQCAVDRAGIHPVRFGRLPAHMAALCASNMRFFDLAATAAIEKSKETAIHALMLDPLTSAVCTPAEIREMTLRLFDAEKKFLKEYK